MLPGSHHYFVCVSRAGAELGRAVSRLDLDAAAAEPRESAA